MSDITRRNTENVPPTNQIISNEVKDRDHALSLGARPQTAGYPRYLRAAALREPSADRDRHWKPPSQVTVHSPHSPHSCHLPAQAEPDFLSQSASADPADSPRNFQTTSSESRNSKMFNADGIQLNVIADLENEVHR